jgi:hypothetical protein
MAQNLSFALPGLYKINCIPTGLHPVLLYYAAFRAKYKTANRNKPLGFSLYFLPHLGVA